jgi:hypothetical protein
MLKLIILILKLVMLKLIYSVFLHLSTLSQLVSELFSSCLRFSLGFVPDLHIKNACRLVSRNADRLRFLHPKTVPAEYALGLRVCRSELDRYINLKFFIRYYY